MRYVLAWDLGTSAAKVGLVNPNGAVLGTEVEPTTLLLLPDGGAEQDPEDWWRALSTATDRLLARELVPRTEIAALAVTAQWAGTVPIDAAGRPLMNAMIWMDARGQRYSDARAGGRWNVGGYAPLKLARWVRRTGGAPVRSGKDPFAHILWIRERRPEVYERTHKFLEPKDYLNFRLTGRLTSTIDTITLHWVTDNRDLGRVRYDADLLALAGLERDKLPELCRASDVLGRLTSAQCSRFGLSDQTIVAGGAPDVHTAAIGAGTTRDFDAHLYVGTSSWLGCHVPHKKTSIVHNLATLPSALPDRYLVLNDHETAGACLVHLKEKLFFPADELRTADAPADVYAAFDRMAESSPPGSRGLFFLPWLYGERSPEAESLVRGGLVNYSLLHERSDVIRAVYEGIALNTRDLLEHLEAFLGRSMPALRFIGGGAKSASWAQIFADVLDRPILVVREPQSANLRGAALIAYVALGELRFEDVPDLVPIASRFEPRSQHRAVYDAAFSRFMNLHRAAAPVLERLKALSKSR